MNLAEAAQERLQGFFPELLGVKFVEVTPDAIKAELPARDELRSVPGIVHGGAIMALADTLGAVATVMNMPGNARTTTIESKTNFFRPLSVPGTVHAECTPLHRGRTTMVWQTRITDADGKLAALVTQTQIVIPAD